MKIRILQVGKNKDSYIPEVSGEFIKRISPYAKIDILELSDCPISKTTSSDTCRATEAQSILKNINDDDFVIVLDEHGKEINSVEFSKFISEKKDFGKSLCFVIGGPFGLDKSVLNRADFLLSVSKMTFTHLMIRIFLLEQIYRAFSIIHGKGYHH